MINRADAVDEAFKKTVLEEQFPIPLSSTSLDESGLSPYQLVDLFHTQIMSRHGDLLARKLRARGESFYTIGSAGHEGNAAIAQAFRPSDMAFLHYRSGAFFTQRSKQVPGTTPTYDLMLSFVASSEDPISGGRHKVFGSKALSIPPQTSTIASHLPKAVGAAYSIARSRQLKLEPVIPHDGVVVCSFGDASSNHATAQTAFNQAEWIAYQGIPLPLVFVCEDNGIGISVPTPQGWIGQAFSKRGVMKYFACDGLSLLDTARVAREVEYYVRTFRKPAFLHFRAVRLLAHAGSDIESTYHSQQQILETEEQDPLLHSARLVLENGLLSKEAIVELYEKTRKQMERVAEVAITRPKLRTSQAVMESILPPSLKKVLSVPLETLQAQRPALFAKEAKSLGEKQPLSKHLTWGLADLMAKYPQTVLFGEDVGKKGGVYGITSGLQSKFGLKRVFDTALDETSILGAAMGMAHNGMVPIPEIQFLAYLHNAEDQIRGEASTLPFFSQGLYTNPMVLRIAGLAYQKGFGGHFHNDNSLAVLRDIPGLIIATPSRGRDAALMLRSCAKAAVCDQRVVVFIEPIALYMTRDLHEKGDDLWADYYPDPFGNEEIQIGEFGIYETHPGTKPDLTVITYANGTFLTRQAADHLKQVAQVKLRIVDLRWIAPIREKELCELVAQDKHVLMVEECRRTGSLSEGLMAMLAERLPRGPRLHREAAEDCFIPLGVAATSGLPSKESIAKKICEILEIKP